jgi:hypothetical protein
MAWPTLANDAIAAAIAVSKLGRKQVVTTAEIDQKEAGYRITNPLIEFEPSDCGDCNGFLRWLSLRCNCLWLGVAVRLHCRKKEKMAPTARFQWILRAYSPSAQLIN